MSERETSDAGKASEILRRRDGRVGKLQRAIDRGSPRSQTEALPEEQGTVSDDVTDTEQRLTSERSDRPRRPAKPIRITVDLDANQHRFLRQYALDAGAKGTEVLRGLLAELAEDEELRSRLTERLLREGGKTL